MRTLFSHKFSQQREFESVNGVNARLLSRTAKLNSNPVWHDGLENPQKALGRDGDFYINRTSGDIFKKEKGSWLG